MKKFLTLIATIIILSLTLTGCTSNVTPLSNVGGPVKSGNGTFAVEKGDYVYFVNGMGVLTESNKMGDVLKGALVRVKTSDIGTANANVETVIPKFAHTASATNGVFIYGDTVYHASPYDEKDKTSTVRSDYTDFRSFDLTTAKSNRITYENDTVNSYKFIDSGNGVFLAYEASETIDGKSTNVFKVFNASNGNQVYSVSGYSQLFMAEDNSAKVYFVKLAYSNELEADEAFSEVYSYTMGATDAELVYSGCGTNGLTRDGRGNDASYKAKILPYSDISGATVSLIKNTGKLLVFKVSGIDTNYPTVYYYGVELVDNQGALKSIAVSDLVELGKSDAFIDVALTSTSYFKSLSEVYYIENTTYLKGLVKFNYNNLNKADHGRTLITSEASGYNVSMVDGDYMYLCSTDGFYNRIKLDGSESKLTKITPVAAKGTTDWFAPRVINGKFLCVYSSEIFYKYVYAVDLASVNEDFIEKYEKLDRTKVTELKNTLLGKMTDADKNAFTAKLDTDYPEEE